MEQNVVTMHQPDPVSQRVEAGFPLEPFSDIVVIEQIKDEATSFGLILPGKSGEFQSGRVVAVGPGRVYSTYMDASGNQQIGHFVPMSIKVGDYVIFGKYQSGGEPIVLDGKKYIMAREGDLGGRSVTGEPLKVKLFADQS